MKHLASDLTDVNTIFHISDIHIRKRVRHKEYLRVFDRLCLEIETYIKIGSNDCVVVMTGDIMHDKTELVPESIDILKRFLIKLTNITEVVMIIGNHDTNIFNKDSLDCITPIISNMRTRHKLHLLNEDKVYLYGSTNILFGVTTLWAKRVTSLSDIGIVNLNPNFVKIALYHGMIHGCTLDNGSIAYSNSSYFNQTDFQDYDLVMLGDVHKHQYLNKDRTIAYAGSLIQQKRDEDLLEHGMIKWDIRNKTSKFVRIKNDFGMIQINVKPTDIDKIKLRLIPAYDNFELPRNLDIKIVYGSIESKKLFKTIRDTALKRHNIVKLSEITNTAHDQISISNMIQTLIPETSVNTVVKITDDDAVIKIMMGHLARQNVQVNQIIKDEIKSILNIIDHNYDADVKTISLKSIEFDNMFIYFENNSIDFTKFKNIVGLNASNYSGKSTFIDVILYSIYGEGSRGKRFDALNIYRNKMNSRIVLDVNKIEYVVQRSSFINSLTSRDLKESVTFWENGVNITADNRIKTHQLISKKICSYDDMINNSFILQKHGKCFVDLSDRDKRDLLCKMAQFDVFDKVFVEAKSRHFSVSQALSKMTKKIESYHINVNIDDAKSKPNRRHRKPKLYDTLKKIEDKLNQDLQLVSTNTELIESTIRNLEQELTSLDKTRHNLQNRLSGYDVKKGMFASFDSDRREFNRRCRDTIDFINDSNQIRHDINILKCDRSLNQLKNEHDKIVSDSINRIRCLNDQIEDGLKNLNTVDMTDLDIDNIKGTIKELSDEKDRMTQRRTEFQDRFDRFNSEEFKQHMKMIEITYRNKQLLIDRIQDVKTTQQGIITEIKRLNDLLSELQNHQYNPECEACMNNPTTKDIMRTTTIIEQLEKKLSFIDAELLLLQKQFDIFDSMSVDTAYVTLQDEIKNTQDLSLQIERFDSTINLLERDIIIQTTELTRITKILDQIDSNKEIELKIKILKAEMVSVQTFLKDIEANTDYRKVCGLYSELNLTNSRLNTTLTILYDTSLKQNGLMKFYKDHIIDTIEMPTYEVQINHIDHRSRQIRTRLIELRQDFIVHKTSRIKLEVDLNKFLEIRDEIEELDKRKTVLDHIKKALDKNGLVDTLLSKNIIPHLQKSINSILADVGHYQVDIQYKNQSVNIYKKGNTNVNSNVNSNARTLSVVMNSGYETYLLDLIFRLALVQINNHIKTNFLIIDEGINSCDPEHKNNIKELLEFMRGYYSWILIISHDEYIKSFYDMNISINNVGDGSNITNVDKKIAKRRTIKILKN